MNWKRCLLYFMNVWPPFLGAGVRVKRISPDFRSIDVEMKCRLWNQNYIGTHFGGSLYSMCDPFFMLMLIQNLGKDYIVLDKAAHIRFRKATRSTARIAFRLNKEQIDSIKTQLESAEKVEPEFKFLILGDKEEIIAEVTKLLYVKKKS